MRGKLRPQSLRRLLDGNFLVFANFIALTHSLHHHMLPTALNVSLHETVKVHRRKNESSRLPTKYFQQRFFTKRLTGFDADYLASLKKNIPCFCFVSYLKPTVPSGDTCHLNDIQKRKVL